VWERGGERDKRRGKVNESVGRPEMRSQLAPTRGSERRERKKGGKRESEEEEGKEERKKRGKKGKKGPCVLHVWEEKTKKDF
jgi:hypothetical protein